MPTRVGLESYEIMASHGAYEFEKEQKQPYIISVWVTLSKDVDDDNLEKTLNSCAAKLNAELVSDGYTNSRVYTLLEGDNGTLDVIMGRIYELKIRSDNKFIQQKVFELLRDLNGQILHQPTLQKKLSEAKEIKNVGQISGDIGRLGSDPTKAILKINATYLPSDWQRQINIRNDGSPGTGQWRNIGTFVKTDILKKNDMFIGCLLYTSPSPRDS